MTRFGVLSIPSGSGSGSLTGLGFSPKSISMRGQGDNSNRFTSLGCARLAGAAIIQGSQQFMMSGASQQDNDANILELTSNYTVTITSFDADGFSYDYDKTTANAATVLFCAEG